MNTTELTKHICDQLQESNRRAMSKLIEALGDEKSLSLMEQSLALAAEGHLIESGERPRMPGGFFFYLARKELGAPRWRELVLSVAEGLTSKTPPMAERKAKISKSMSKKLGVERELARSVVEQVGLNNAYNLRDKAVSLHTKTSLPQAKPAAATAFAHLALSLYGVEATPELEALVVEWKTAVAAATAADKAKTKPPQTDKKAAATSKPAKKSKAPQKIVEPQQSQPPRVARSAPAAPAEASAVAVRVAGVLQSDRVAEIDALVARIGTQKVIELTLTAAKLYKSEPEKYNSPDAAFFTLAEGE